LSGLVVECALTHADTPMRLLPCLLVTLLACSSPREEAQVPRLAATSSAPAVASVSGAASVSPPASASGPVVVPIEAAVAPPTSGPTGFVETTIAIGPVTDYSIEYDEICFIERSGKAGCVGEEPGVLGPPKLRYLALKDVKPHLEKGARSNASSNEKAVVAGAEHSCTLLKSGAVECSGSGYQGNTGPGAAKGASNHRIAGVADAVELAAAPGGWTTCALRRGGVVSCWGWTGGWSQPAEMKLMTLPAVAGATRLRMGRDNVCVLDGDGAIQCIGELPTFRPVAVAGLSDVTKLIASSDQACALTSSRDVLCWGRFERQTKSGDTELVVRSRPTKIASGIIDLAGGRTPSRLADLCMVTDAGKVRCELAWEKPVEIPGIEGALEIALGQGHLCARTRDGAVYCWGSNNNLQLGATDRDLVTRELETLKPALRVQGLPPIARIAAGRDSSCAVATDGRVFCWGAGGLLGDGTADSAERHEPKPIEGLRARALALDFTTACAVDLEGGVRCWGSLSGVPPKSAEKLAKPSIERPIELGITGAASVFVGPLPCAKKTSGALTCWNAGGMGEHFIGKYENEPRDWPLLNVRSVASYEAYACIALADGTVRCVGQNEYGTLGRASHDRWTKPVEIKR
jgi:alpha-tubulin suppressor-like RCC1 family protein